MSNTIEVEGLVGADPEVKYTPEGVPVATFNVADSPRKYNKNTNSWEAAGETIWFRVTVFGNSAEQVKETIRKGSPVFVKGTLSFHSWTGKDGVKRENKEIRASKVFLSVRGVTTSASDLAGDYSFYG